MFIVTMEFTCAKFPSTRFIGSKLKIINWIWSCIQDIDFESAMDAFGGTGIFSYMAKKKGKEIYFNDILKFNYNLGLALIENSKIKISDNELKDCLITHKNLQYKNIIKETFSDIYFTNQENAWLDIVIQNINSVSNKYKKALLFSALGQACLRKRPFNLFHRKNLYLRLNDVKRTFHNKTCWDTSFDVYLKHFIEEYNEAIFSNGKNNKATSLDVFELPDNFDLVYLDPPYMSGKGVNYLDMYHFLEGIVDYDDWSNKIEFSKKNRSMKQVKQIKVWSKKNEINGLLDKLIKKFSGNKIVMSYRSDGYPSIRKISEMFREHKGKNPLIYSIPYKYVLSEKTVSEILFVAE